MTWIDPEALQPKRPLVSGRSATLDALLQRLKVADRLFEYNVPSEVRATYSDEQLLPFLRQTYSAKAFVVDEPAEIDRYAQLGDRVELQRRGLPRFHGRRRLVVVRCRRRVGVQRGEAASVDRSHGCLSGKWEGGCGSGAGTVAHRSQQVVGGSAHVAAVVQLREQAATGALLAASCLKTGGCGVHDEHMRVGGKGVCGARALRLAWARPALVDVG